MGRSTVRFIIMIFMLVILHSFALSQETWYVPDDFSTIQGAINDNSVLDGHTIIVKPGTYVENINFLGKKIVLKSSNGYLQTFIDGN